jgi:imidazolonepropionase-like amidohydrolase
MPRTGTATDASRFRRAAGGALLISHAKVYPSPEDPPIEDASVVVRDGQIVEVGAQVSAPPGTPVLSGENGSVMAGYWNTHVHFTEPKWRSRSHQSVAVAERQLADMFTSRGFTTVVDAGSDPRVTLALRRRIESGELRGPRIYTAGPSIFPPHGIPYYLRGELPFYYRWFIPQPRTSAAARRVVERNAARGAELQKLFTGSYVARGRVLPMPEGIARAAVEAAHAHHQLVYSHASNLAGTRIALEAGVDVLAHAPDSTEGIDDALLKRMVNRRMAMVPTLKMFGSTVSANPLYLEPIYDLVRRFRELGGELWFGTDVGYMTDYTTDEEFRALGRCGLDAREILRMLTTSPAARFSVLPRKGTLTPGKRADLVILDGDPGNDLGAFARIRHTVRAGRVIWSRPASQ